jgi:hypothetical protein
MKRFIGRYFFHGAGKIEPADAYYRTKRPMSLSADQKTPSRHSFMLDLANDPEGGPLELLVHEQCRKYGPVSRTAKGFALNGPNYRAHQWELSNEQVSEALSLLETVHKESPASKNRAHVQKFWRFKFVDPDSGTLLPDQENMPEIDVRVGPVRPGLHEGNKTSLYAWFPFPLEEASPDFEHSVVGFQNQLIFSFSSKHWRFWNFYPVRGWWPKKSCRVAIATISIAGVISPSLTTPALSTTFFPHDSVRSEKSAISL